MSCNQENPACDNPCKPEHKNTAAHESLESQVLNFSKEFFGELVQTQVDGQTFWSLPCRLDVGLPNNERGATEPLGCYFLRLFQNGVTGLTGVEGNPGNNGRNGRVAYVSGGAAILGPQGPQGPIGNRGLQGQQGIQGIPGVQGNWFTSSTTVGATAIVENRSFVYKPPVLSYGLITNTTSAQVTVPVTGTYLWFYMVSIVGGAILDFRCDTKLTNSTTSVDIPNSTFSLEQNASGAGALNSSATPCHSGITSAATGDTIGLYAQQHSTNTLGISWAGIVLIRIM